MSFSTEKTVSGKGSIKLQFPTFTGKRATGSPSDPDYATYGNSSVTYHLDGANLEKYNRIVFSIYPDCDGARIVNMNLTFRNADTPAKKDIISLRVHTSLTLLIRSGTNASSK